MHVVVRPPTSSCPQGGWTWVGAPSRAPNSSMSGLEPVCRRLTYQAGRCESVEQLPRCDLLRPSPQLWRFTTHEEGAPAAACTRLDAPTHRCARASSRVHSVCRSRPFEALSFLYALSERGNPVLFVEGTKKIAIVDEEKIICAFANWALRKIKNFTYEQLEKKLKIKRII